MVKSILQQLSEERKQLQAEGELPDWFTTHGWQMFKEKYQYEGQSLRETYWRIARCAAKHLPKDQDIWAQKFFDIAWKGWLAFSTPVLANMGTPRGCPVSCSGQFISDSVYGFYSNRLETAILTKNGFGTSGYLGDIRPRGAEISKGRGKASGSLPVFKMFVQDMRDINQNTRRGAWAGYLPIDHADFYEVSNYLMNHPDDLNIGWNVTEAFIERLNTGDGDAVERYQRAMKIRALTGKGYFHFVDKANALSPQMYKDANLLIKGSNLCQEIELFSDEEHTFTCVLSSMNAHKFDEWKSTDAVFTATVFLDCVAQDFIEIAKDVKGLEKAVRFTEKGRALGLGLLGFHSYLQAHSIPFESLEAGYKNTEIFKHLHEESMKASKWMAKELGEPAWCKGYGVRNTHRCVTGDTRILTSTGQHQIKDLVGKNIKVWNGEEYTETQVFETGDSDILRVHFSNGMWLDCTPDHRFLVATAQRTTSGMFSNYFQTVEACDLRHGDCLPKFKVETATENRNVLPYAYTAGLFCADGSINNSQSGKYPRNELRLYGVKQALSPHVEWKSSKTWGDDTVTRGYLPDDILPKYVVPFDYDIHSQLSWLAGLIDGDGTSTSRGITISMKSQTFARDVALLVQSLGGEISITQALRTGGYQGGSPIYWVVNISLFSLGTEWLATLPTKRVKVPKIKSVAKAGKTHFNKVCHIERLPIQPTYCFTEPKRGLGVFNGVLTKQCAVAPNTTSALICGGVSQGIEPVSANVYNQPSAAGELERINPEFIKVLEGKGKYTPEVINDINYKLGSVQHLDFLSEHEKRVFKTAYEIDQHVIIRLAAARQRFIDQGQSLNLFFDADEDEAYISSVHQEAFLNPWIKGLYYMRTLAGVQASKGEECEACSG